MKLDREVIERLRFVSKNEQTLLLRMLSRSKHEPGVTLALAIFRDAFVFRDMVNALIIDMQAEIGSLRSRITELEGNEKEE